MVTLASYKLNPQEQPSIYNITDSQVCKHVTHIHNTHTSLTERASDSSVNISLKLNPARDKTHSGQARAEELGSVRVGQGVFLLQGCKNEAFEFNVNVIKHRTSKNL